MEPEYENNETEQIFENIAASKYEYPFGERDSYKLCDQDLHVRHFNKLSAAYQHDGQSTVKECRYAYNTHCDNKNCAAQIIFFSCRVALKKISPHNGKKDNNKYQN